MQVVPKQMSPRHIKLTKVIHSPQAWTCNKEVVCSHSLLLRDSVGELEGAGGGGTKGMFPIDLFFPLFDPTQPRQHETGLCG